MRPLTGFILGFLVMIVFDSYVISWYSSTGILKGNRAYTFEFNRQMNIHYNDSNFSQRSWFTVHLLMKSYNYGKLWVIFRSTGTTNDPLFDSSKFDPLDVFEKRIFEKRILDSFQIPVHFESTDGIIANAYFDPKDTVYSKNLKREILSMLNLKRFPIFIDETEDSDENSLRYETNFTTKEASLYGNCSSTYYGIIPSDNKQFYLKKMIHHGECEYPTLPLEYQMNDLIYPYRLKSNDCNQATVCDYHMTGNFKAYGLENIDCKSETSCRFSSNASIKTSINTKLFLHHYTFENYEDDDYEFTVESLLHQPDENQSDIWVNIINGVPVKKGYHHSCQLVDPQKKHACTCSIVGDSIVLLSAHCIVAIQSPDQWFIYAGSYKSVDPDAEIYQVRRAEKMPSFNGKWKEGHDVGVINIQGKFNFNNPMIKKIRVIRGTAQNVFENYKTAGFGRTETGQLSPVLLKAKFHHVKKDQCQKQQIFKLVDQLCFKSRTQAIGKGDSGSGIFHKKDYNLLLAVTSASLLMPNEMFWASDLSHPEIQQFLEKEHIFDDEMYRDEV